MNRTLTWKAVAVGVLGAAIAAFVLIRIVSALFGGDPAGLLRPSVNDAPNLEMELSREVPIAAGQGHDGIFFFYQSIDPWITEPEYLDDRLDNNVYRAGRMLYPAVASLLGLLEPEHIVWTLAVVNALAVGFGAFSLARMSQRRERTALIGLAVALNLGVFFELAIDGSSVLAFALLLAGFASLERNAQVPATLFFAGSILSRELMLIGVLGAVAFVAKRGSPRGAVKVLALSVVPRLAWQGYLLWRFSGIEEPFSSTARNLDIPFRGLIEAVPVWRTASFLNQSMIALTALAAAVVIWKAVASPSVLGWGTVGFALLPAVLSIAVTEQVFDLSRVVLPVFSAAIALLAFDLGAAANDAASTPQRDDHLHDLSQLHTDGENDQA